MEKIGPVGPVGRICLIPGLGSHPASFAVIRSQLARRFKHAQIVALPCETNSVSSTDELLDIVDHLCSQYFYDKSIPIVFVGQSMGGLAAINMHKRGWNVQACIAVASPLNGSQRARALVALAGSNGLNGSNGVAGLVVKMVGQAVAYLASLGKHELPSANYWTISFGWFNSNDDSKVFAHEATIDPARHTHMPWMDHMLGFLSIKCANQIADCILMCLDAGHPTGISTN